MTDDSTWAPRPPTRPRKRRGRRPLRHQLRLRILGRRLLALVAALMLVVAAQLRPNPATDRHAEQSDSGQSDSGQSGSGPRPDSSSELSPAEQAQPTALAQRPDQRGPNRPTAIWHDLGADERALALVAPLAPLPLEAGDRIELVGVAADDLGGVRVEPLTAVIEVLSVSAEAIVVAVPATNAPRIIEFQAAGAIEILAVP